MKNERSNNGIGLGGVLFVVFLVLKLTHVIDWSWWWITAPLWVSVLLVIVLIGFVEWLKWRDVRKHGTRFQQRMRQFNAEREKIISEQKKHK